MSEKMTLERVRKKFSANTSEIKEEYERKIKELEVKIEQLKNERDARLTRAEKQFRKDSCITLKWLVGQEDYNWLNEWLAKNKEKEMKEAEKRHKTKHVNQLKEMGVEDYLFYYFNSPKIEGRLKKEMKQSKSEEAERLSLILTKLKLENLRLVRTRI
jgi:hypothetical protein